MIIHSRAVRSYFSGKSLTFEPDGEVTYNVRSTGRSRVELCLDEASGCPTLSLRAPVYCPLTKHSGGGENVQNLQHTTKAIICRVRT